MSKASLLICTAWIACLASTTQAFAEEQHAGGPDASASEVARLRAEVEELKAEMRAMRAQLAQPAVAMPPPAPSGAQASPPPAAPPEKGKDDIQISWKGAPEFKTASGWSFKPRGRMQIDGGYLDAPASRATGQRDGRGFTNRVRRAYIGAQGTMPGGFGYRAEVDLANGVNWTDLFITYDKGPFNITVGQHHPFTSMEQLDSDLYLTFTERASFIGAFNLERRVGISAGYKSDSFMANAGVFTDDMNGLQNDGDKSVSIDGRLVWMPRFGPTQLHLAASAHRRNLGDFQATIGTQYRQRPYIGTSDIRYVDTGVLTVNRETHFGGELALNRKRFHFAAEGARFKVDRPGSADPVFFGGYAEVGLFLTDDSRAYRNGAFERVSPSKPVGGGGWGALEVNARYDRLDLTDAGVGGGTQDGYGASVIWIPNAYVRFMIDYMHLVYDIPSAQPVFNAEVVGMRAQLDF
jgi:phosphate-selective porin OprO/OprP